MVSVVDLVKLPSLWFCCGADGCGMEEGCGGNEEEKGLRRLKLTCVEETGKVLFISCCFHIKM